MIVEKKYQICSNCEHALYNKNDYYNVYCKYIHLFTLNTMIIKYQILGGYREDNGEPVLDSPTIYTAETKPGESFETPRLNAWCHIKEEYYDRGDRYVELRRKKDMIIPVRCEGGNPLQPRKITKQQNGHYLLWYSWPSRKSWSQGSTCMDIHIISVEE